jgi:hypothetical protein
VKRRRTTPPSWTGADGFSGVIVDDLNDDDDDDDDGAEELIRRDDFSSANLVSEEFRT